MKHADHAGKHQETVQLPHRLLRDKFGGFPLDFLCISEWCARSLVLLWVMVTFSSFNTAPSIDSAARGLLEMTLPTGAADGTLGECR